MGILVTFQELCKYSRQKKNEYNIASLKIFSGTEQCYVKSNLVTIINNDFSQFISYAEQCFMGTSYKIAGISGAYKKGSCESNLVKRGEEQLSGSLKG